MIKTKTYKYAIVLLILTISLSSCVIDNGAWLGLVGCWQDQNDPEYMFEFTKSGYFYQIEFPNTIWFYGDFYARNNQMSLNYISACDDCDVTFIFEIIDDYAIFTDSNSNYIYKKINCPYINNKIHPQ